MIKVVLENFNKTLTCAKGETIFEVLRRNEIPFGCSCNGEFICGSCMIEILDGQNNLSTITQHLQLIIKHNLTQNQRLACATKILGDITIKTDYW
ncbi:MAG: 2Fe-2S iron-sulfur cluster binding domain-containing protein [Ignavibacteria bacterium]|nr:2Fe-2S iron-sulfur cluster binding domain-containing protein [Ignavibacteria bacterium]